MLKRLACTLLLLILATSSAWAAIAHVQSRGDGVCGGACGSTVEAYASDNSAGGLLVACMVLDPAQTVSTVADSQGNSWQRAVQIAAGGGGTVDVWYAMDAAAGANTVTATYSASASYAALMIHEYSGAATSGALDVVASQNQTNPGTGANAVSSSANTTTVDGALIFGCTGEGAGTGTLSAGTSFTLRVNVFTDSPSEDRIQTTAGSVSATFTTTDATSLHSTVMATFKPFVASTARPSLSLLGVGR